MRKEASGAGESIGFEGRGCGPEGVESSCAGLGEGLKGLVFRFANQHVRFILMMIGGWKSLRRGDRGRTRDSSAPFAYSSR